MQRLWAEVAPNFLDSHAIALGIILVAGLAVGGGVVALIVLIGKKRRKQADDDAS